MTQPCLLPKHAPNRSPRPLRVALLLVIAAFAPTGPSRAAEAGPKPVADSCLECHGDARFLVTNKKLYDYYQQWAASIHAQEEVACRDCHGGDPSAPSKEKAHGDGVSESDEQSGIYFANVIDTCGRCHEKIRDGFRKSTHFEHVLASEQEEQGPTCVTCHGSIDVGILNVNSVEAACARCHNEESDNHPENPDEAREILNHFLSIHRFYRYITIRSDPAEAREFFKDVDVLLQQLAVTWHTFDLERIQAQTRGVLALLRQKRNELRRRGASAD